MTKRLTAIIERESGGFVALCPELDIASQGGSVDEARNNLQEALEFFLKQPPKSRFRTGFTVRCT